MEHVWLMVWLPNWPSAGVSYPFPFNDILLPFSVLAISLCSFCSSAVSPYPVFSFYLSKQCTNACVQLELFFSFAIHALIFVYKRLVFSQSARRRGGLMAGERAYPVNRFLTTSCRTACLLIPETIL